MLTCKLATRIGISIGRITRQFSIKHYNEN